MVIGEKHYKHTDEGPCRSSRRTRSPSAAIPTSTSTATPATVITSTDDSDDNVVQIGSDFQAEVPDCVADAVYAATELTHATLLWSPNPELSDSKVDLYIEVAYNKYGYNEEQALGMLLWHKHNVDKALADLANYTSYPDIWTLEDKVLFEQAFYIHGKNFQRIRSLLPEKSCFELVKYYYVWKKTLNKGDDASVRQAVVGEVRDTVAEEETDSDFEVHKVATLTGESSAKQKVSSTNVNVSTVQRGKDEARSRPRLKCKPPRSMCLSREDLASAVTVPSGSVPGEMLVKVTDSQLLTLRRQVQSNKHVISTYRQRHEFDITSLRPSQCLKLINPKWTTHELLLAVQGVRKYGTDFAPIAEVIGNKMASHVRSFFVTYRQRFCLDDVLRDNKHDLSSVRMNKTGDGQPVEAEAGASAAAGCEHITPLLSSSPPLLLCPALTHLQHTNSSKHPPQLPHAATY